MLHFCSITTTSHLFKAYALADSLGKFGYTLFLLVLEEDFKVSSYPSNIQLLKFSDLRKSEGINLLVSKYAKNKDKLRWALKPALLLYLLNQYPKIVYVDNDTYFYNNPNMIEPILDTHIVLLTPHNYNYNPLIKQNWFEANFRVGLYNAGFFAVSQNGKAALLWWLNCCLHNLKKSYTRGLFDDQKYLDLLPIVFDHVYILKNKGFNVAGWNIENYSISRNSNNQILLGNDVLIFIHFANLTLKTFAHKNHPLNKEYLNYINHLNIYKTNAQNKIYQFRFFEIREMVYHLKRKLLRLFE